MIFTFNPLKTDTGFFLRILNGYYVKIFQQLSHSTLTVSKVNRSFCPCLCQILFTNRKKSRKLPVTTERSNQCGNVL